ncbi:hypothetical protein ABZ419_15390 [Streptomyces cinnamoneus]|uniref:hypothetical protein n=1 Tax=Streptomyces cinnamoneus TaxID=53446 RepID=UPI00340FF728
MFEIRIICNPADTDRITTALGQTFTTGTARQYPTRDGRQTRLYITADHEPDTGAWPTPDEAYAKAPSLISEIGWTARHVRDGLTTANPDDARLFWLRKAASLDRIALDDARHGAEGDALVAAIEAAHQFRTFDAKAPDTYGDGPHDPDGDEAFMSPRGYVRQEYAHWINAQ